MSTLISFILGAVFGVSVLVVVACLYADARASDQEESMLKKDGEHHA